MSLSRPAKGLIAAGAIAVVWGAVWWSRRDRGLPPPSGTSATDAALGNRPNELIDRLQDVVIPGAVGGDGAGRVDSAGTTGGGLLGSAWELLAGSISITDYIAAVRYAHGDDGQCIDLWQPWRTVSEANCQQGARVRAAQEG